MQCHLVLYWACCILRHVAKVVPFHTAQHHDLGGVYPGKSKGLHCLQWCTGATALIEHDRLLAVLHEPEVHQHVQGTRHHFPQPREHRCVRAYTFSFALKVTL